MAFNDCIENELTLREKKLLVAVQMAYRKHHMNDDSIGWKELSDQLQVVLAEVMGDKGYQAWIHKTRFEVAYPIYSKSERGA